MEKKFQELESSKITNTISVLSSRIRERFPNSGLHGVSRKLLDISLHAEEQVKWISQPILALRISVSIIITLLISGLIFTLTNVKTVNLKMDLVQLIEFFEAGVNDLVLISIAIFFLITVETRFKRHRALKSIHELRAIAHIIDMHQLSKDPIRKHWENSGKLTPKSEMTPLEISRYLDYCSELLSLVGKVSVLYVQKFDDVVALSAVNEVENLTTGLSRKIWQKLMIMQNSNFAEST